MWGTRAYQATVMTRPRRSRLLHAGFLAKFPVRGGIERFVFQDEAAGKRVEVLVGFGEAPDRNRDGVPWARSGCPSPGLAPAVHIPLRARRMPGKGPVWRRRLVAARTLL